MFYYHFFNKTKVKIRLKTTQEGGREKAVISSDYRVDHKLDFDSDVLTMGVVYLNNYLLLLGVEQEETVEFIVSDIEANTKINKLKIGDKWEIYEGKKCVGECELLEFVL